MLKKTIVEKHFDDIANRYDNYKRNNAYYYTNLKKLLKSHIPKKSHVLEIGCGTGDILSALEPKDGYGMDLSSEMVRIAKAKHFKNKRLNFSVKFPAKKFDYIFMTDVIEHLEDPEKVFLQISKLMHKDSVFINTMANPLWEPLLLIWEWLGWKMPEGKHNRISFNKIKQILSMTGFKVVKHDFKLLVPIDLPFISKFINTYLERSLKKLSFIEYFVAVRS